MSILRDIDYAATAVQTALVGKFGRASALDDLRVAAGDKTIRATDGKHVAEGTRDDLLAAVRKASSYAEFWQLCPRAHR